MPVIRAEYLPGRDETNSYKKIKLYEAAVELYKGPFLADVDATWFAMERQRYLEMYLATLQTLFNALSIRITRESLEIRERSSARTSNEEAYRNAMRIIMSSATRQGSSAFYEQCKQHYQGIRLEPPAKPNSSSKP